MTIRWVDSIVPFGNLHRGFGFRRWSPAAGRSAWFRDDRLLTPEAVPVSPSATGKTLMSSMALMRSLPQHRRYPAAMSS